MYPHHLKTRDDGDTFICYICDPTVKRFGKQTSLQGLSLNKGQASGLQAGDGQEDIQSDNESLPSPSRLWTGVVVGRSSKGCRRSEFVFKAREDEEEARCQLPPPLTQSQDSNFNKSKELIKDIHDKFPASISMDYEVDALTEGFLQFVRLKKLKGFRSLEEYYANFYNLSRNV